MIKRQLNIRFIIYLIFALFISSCASTEKYVVTNEVSDIDETGNYKYEAWRPSHAGGFEAINILLDETDVLMANQAYDAAADKLERVLRIKPQYAPAWSRLAWLALQTDSPGRSVQMAKRSNSFAYSVPELQSLNWSFIRAASKSLQDEKTYNRANQEMEALKVF